ncbi:MAG: hypothetical protein WBC91_12045 [Phototrophicaceae bacterium]
MDRKWNVTQEIEQAHQAQVFSGGACNILDENGKLLRNGERDHINDWLTEKQFLIFDPQIHPDTHGEEYLFEKHSKIEIIARDAAKINLYEISPRTFGGITSLEIAIDHFRWHEPMVLYFSDGYTLEDNIPEHDVYGSPKFVPYGIHKNDTANMAHYREMRKNANNMRKFLMRLARDMSNLTVSFSRTSTERDVVITSDRMHAAEIFEAVVKALKGERVFIHFPSDVTEQDANGNPIFLCPDNPAQYQLHAWLDQYLDAGNELRAKIAELVNVNVFVRVVYTQRNAISALEELLKLKKMLKDSDG